MPSKNGPKTNPMQKPGMQPKKPKQSGSTAKGKDKGKN